MPHVKALEAGQSSHGTSEPIRPVLYFHKWRPILQVMLATPKIALTRGKPSIWFTPGKSWHLCKELKRTFIPVIRIDLCPISYAPDITKCLLIPLACLYCPMTEAHVTKCLLIPLSCLYCPMTEAHVTKCLLIPLACLYCPMTEAHVTKCLLIPLSCLYCPMTEAHVAKNLIISCPINYSLHLP